MTVGGCGMDMVFHSVMNLSYSLHGHGRDEDQGTAQERARMGKLARGVVDKAGDWSPRRPGYTLRSD